LPTYDGKFCAANQLYSATLEELFNGVQSVNVVDSSILATRNYTSQDLKRIRDYLTLLGVNSAPRLIHFGDRVVLSNELEKTIALCTNSYCSNAIHLLRCVNDNWDSYYLIFENKRIGKDGFGTLANFVKKLRKIVVETNLGTKGMSF
jgi:hypothetical protein